MSKARPPRTLRSILWSALTFLLLGALLPVLSRVVAPEDVGLLGMVIVIMGVMAGFSGFGLDGAVIHTPDLDHELSSSAFWLSSLVGAVLATIGVLAAPLVAMLYRNEEVGEIMRALPLVFLFTSASVVPTALLKKRLQFERLALQEFLFALTLVTTTLTLTFSGHRIWAVVIGILAGTFVRALAALGLARFVPAFHLHWARLKPLLKFSIYYSGASSLNQLVANFDYLVIGRYVGKMLLGYYTTAYAIIRFPLSKVSAAVTHVQFPAFSRIQHDDEALRKQWVTMIRYLLHITGSLLVYIGFMAPEVVGVIFGPQWSPSVRLIRILLMVGLLKAIANPVGSVINAKGRTEISFYWNLFSLFLVVPAFYFGVTWVPDRFGIDGAEAVAWAYASVYPISFLAIQKLTLGLIGLKAKDYLKGLAPAIKLLAALSVGCLGLRLLADHVLYPAGIPLIAVFVLTALLALTMAVGLAYLLDRPFLNDALNRRRRD